VTNAGGEHEEFGEFMDQVGEGLDPFKALTKALDNCGRTKYRIEGSVIHIDKGEDACPNLNVQTTSRSCELFCVTCGITCEIKLKKQGQGDKPAAPEEEDELGEFLGKVEGSDDDFGLSSFDDDEP
jgi:hypothetical protein